ncbi:unnamed protein product [Aphis gossypii]|uniref:Transposable element P transposase-like GTP-binding insertion domain-containing protein n=1 Tax=Aphis gossypii TaxID=80765 RepID=A0A9P0J8R3_APHGO|nr:unnamed protein product [Aphis gossypii]
MWKLFGISDVKSSCTHPVKPKRKLWFASDFPHLIMYLKSRIINSKTLQVPEGTVDVLHWKAVVEADSKFQIKVCNKLTIDNVQPRYFQTMNVKMAFKFFSGSVAAAMQYYKDSIPAMIDCSATVLFIKKINEVVDAMNSQLPKCVLRPDPASIHNKVKLNLKLSSFPRYQYKVSIKLEVNIIK